MTRYTATLYQTVLDELRLYLLMNIEQHQVNIIFVFPNLTCTYEGFKSECQ